MIEVEIYPVWRIRSNGHVRELDVLLIAVLSGLCEAGSLTLAARAAGIRLQQRRQLSVLLPRQKGLRQSSLSNVSSP